MTIANPYRERLAKPNLPRYAPKLRQWANVWDEGHNHHDELVEALKGLLLYLDMLEEYSNEGGLLFHGSINQANAILTEVEA